MIKCSPLTTPNIRILGRHDGKEPLRLLWTASGIEFDLRGEELWVDVEADYGKMEPWLAVTLHDRLIIRFPLQKGRNRLCLLRGLDKDKPHPIHIFRESQAMPEDPDSTVILHAIEIEGELAPLPEKKLRLEVIGDSLTSAEGSYGTPEDTEWLPIWFSGAYGYPQRLSQLLDADVRVLSQSGWGTLSSWDNNPHYALPLYYEQVCGVCKSGRNAAPELNDFTAWKPDVVICQLGANDSGAMNGPAYTDPETGIVYKQTAEDTTKLQAAQLAFWRKMRACNPDAYLMWCVFPTAPAVKDALEKATARYLAESGDRRAACVPIERMKADGVRNHPSIEQHQWFAGQLKPLVERVLSL